jgi:hypothetical protein
MSRYVIRVESQQQSAEQDHWGIGGFHYWFHNNTLRNNRMLKISVLAMYRHISCLAHEQIYPLNSSHPYAPLCKTVVRAVRVRQRSGPAVSGTQETIFVAHSGWSPFSKESSQNVFPISYSPKRASFLKSYHSQIVATKKQPTVPVPYLVKSKGGRTRYGPSCHQNRWRRIGLGDLAQQK